MIEKDTVRLLRECDAGIKMGVESIDEVVDRVNDPDFRRCLVECKKSHETLGDEIRSALDRFGDDGKNPNPIARGMSFMKTEAEMLMNGSDATVADLMTYGCNMGVKSLSKYLNQYKAADEDSKSIAKRLISLEERLAQDIRRFL